MPETTESRDIITTAQEAVEPHEVDTGLYIVRDSHGTVHTVDLADELEQRQAQPHRKTGARTVSDVDSLVGYLAKHGVDDTELWGDPDRGTIRAIINAHGSANGDGGDDTLGTPGWGDHTATLTLKHSKDWTDWLARDGKLHSQVEFAEFIEDHLPNFVTPNGAEMLELAQTFQATTRVDFDSSQRLKSGETQVTYKEDTDAKAGKRGQIAIPDTFQIGIQVYEHGTAYRVDARLRYRIDGGTLRLGYRLTRHRDVLLDAFKQVAAAVETGSERTVWLT